MPCRGTACHKFLEPARLLHSSYFRAISTNHARDRLGDREEKAFPGEGEKKKKLIKKGGVKKEQGSG